MRYVRRYIKAWVHEHDWEHWGGGRGNHDLDIPSRTLGGRPSSVAALRDVSIVCDTPFFGDRGRPPSRITGLT